METKLVIQTVHTPSYSLREDSFEGKKYLIVPVVMMVEGVHHGSHGPILHKAEELSNFSEAWNGIPVVVYHPEQDGVNISANSPEVIDKSGIGRVFNVHMDGEKLKGEVWIDLVKAQEKFPNVLAHIRNGLPMEVSVGVFSDHEESEGNWNGEDYQMIAHNYRPDHLALLPGQQGACSWNDGCGLRTNNMKGGIMEQTTMEVFKQLNKEGYFVSPVVNEQGYRELMDSVRSKLDAMDNDLRMYFLVELYEDRVIYAVRGNEGSQTLYQQGYEVNDKSEISFTGDPVEVRQKVEYVTNKMRRNKMPSINLNKKEVKMACCEDKVDRLIANKLTQYTADDKEWLMTLEEDKLEKMAPKEPKAIPVVNKDEVISEYKKSLTKVDDYLAIMPESVKNQIQSGLEMYKQDRDEKITTILDNGKGDFQKEELEAMADTLLEKIFNTVKVVDYSGAAGSGGSGEEEIPALTSNF